MEYDTLILSGGSVKGYALLGSFKYLINTKKLDIKKLKHIISASVGSLMALPLILNVSINMRFDFHRAYSPNAFAVVNVAV